MTFNKKHSYVHTLIQFSLLVFFASIASSIAHAGLNLNSVTFDPEIIASGDEVDVVIQYIAQDEESNDFKIEDPTYTFQARLVADDDISQQHVQITKSTGDEIARVIVGGLVYQQRFRLKLSTQAPAATYQLKLEGQWYKNGVAIGTIQSVKVYMDVKREGITLSLGQLDSSPRKIRAGDKEIQLFAQITNSGEKQAKNIHISLSLPQGIDSSYANSNRLSIGSLASGQSSPITFTIDTDKMLSSGIHTLNMTYQYEDLDGNTYAKNETIPISIHKRPYLIISESHGQGVAGSKGHLNVTVTNIGQDIADASDIRLIKQSSQPFEMDVRTQYLGQLKPGESATAHFEFDVLDEATLSQHKMTAALRSKGNANDGDDSIYTFTDSVSLQVTHRVENPYPLYALYTAIVIGIVIIIVMVLPKNKK